MKLSETHFLLRFVYTRNGVGPRNKRLETGVSLSHNSIATLFFCDSPVDTMAAIDHLHRREGFPRVNLFDGTHSLAFVIFSYAIFYTTRRYVDTLNFQSVEDKTRIRPIGSLSPMPLRSISKLRNARLSPTYRVANKSRNIGTGLDRTVFGYGNSFVKTIVVRKLLSCKSRKLYRFYINVFLFVFDACVYTVSDGKFARTFNVESRFWV